MSDLGTKDDIDVLQDFPDVWPVPALKSPRIPIPDANANSSEPLDPPVVILGVPFAHLTFRKVVQEVDAMVASGQSHYLVTANVDFLVQSLHDEELRRILLEADRVLCDGTPLVWASHYLGNPLPERVAGSDLVPLLLELAAKKNYRVFFLGGEPEVAARAVEAAQSRFGVEVCGHYSPPFKPLLEMDHDAIIQRIQAAKPDLLFVSFGCPKAEKWISMHFRKLGVPVAIGVGGTIDFLAGRVKRAPAWMQRCGLEWLYRLAQEPRRLYRRYVLDLWHFTNAFTRQCLFMRRQQPPAATVASATAALMVEPTWRRIVPPAIFDRASIGRDEKVWRASRNHHCLLDASHIESLDSTAVGLLMVVHKTLCKRGFFLILLKPSEQVVRVLRLLHLENYFITADDTHAARELILKRGEESSLVYRPHAFHPTFPLIWRGEITAANAEEVWTQVESDLEAMSGFEERIPIDLSEVRFIDSTGVGILARTKKHGDRLGVSVQFTEVPPRIQNVLRLCRMECLMETRK